jgi:hypothetical protein
MHEPALESQLERPAPNGVDRQRPRPGRSAEAVPPPPREIGGEYAGLLRDFQSAIDARLRAEQELVEVYGLPEDEQERQLKRALGEAEAIRTAAIEETDAKYERLRHAAEHEFQTTDERQRGEHLARTREIEARFARELAELEQKYHDSSWVTSSVLDDSAEDSPKRVFERNRQLRERSHEQQAAELAALETAYQSLAEERRWRGTPPPAPAAPPRTCDEAQSQFAGHVAAANAAAEQLRALKLPRLFVGFRPLLLFIVVLAAVFAPLFLLLDPALFEVSAGRVSPPWIGLTTGAAFVIALVLVAVVYTLASLQQNDVLRDLQAHVFHAGWFHQSWLALARRDQQQQQAQFEARQVDFAAQRQEALDRYERAHAERRAELERARLHELHVADSACGEQQAALRAAHEATMAALEHESGMQRTGEAERYATDLQQRQQALDEYSQQRRRRQAEHWHRLKTTWFESVRKVEAGADAARTADQRQFFAWDELAGERWSPPAHVPSAVRIGEIEIDLQDWPGAVPQDMRLAPRSTHVALPVTLPFPASPSLLFKMSGAEGRAAAVRTLQTMLLRLLTLVPPGKLRFTILDPVGLGESFAGLMHLADYDELLVTRRIWTESGQIEERLADLTGHMENVLQKYLRNEFATIEQYNEYAGEVAEPYHILVISDFPAKFTEIAARRLTSIVTSGPRCGVYTLMSLDTQLDLPHNFQVSVLEEHLSTFVWRKGVLHATGGSLSRWPLKVDEPPPPETFTRIVKRVGEASRDARRVEVAFERVAPRPEQVWTGSSRSGIDVPLGRAGAMKLQHLRLGRGTSQHMLIAGKTGSGKSTFLHALITNAALHYSPDEIRFYLIDFKKGVEFKDYASFQLPHAEVIAIESDREFGVSALQRLDDVLKERGDLFRRHGVQDLAGFRDACPDEPLPRILLVIDEFQEFFVEDDKLSQTAALLLDRLVRQGRAFGIHVVLGSQTLGGAYSLARSTLGQVAVRVALQCSEADAHLILSEENSAARLLTRPGEAIYNDANGLLEGNHPFQVAWLPDDQRETYLRQIAALAERRAPVWPPAIVFEGNVPSDAARNVHLARLLAAPPATGTGAIPAAPQFWLGEAVEIKQPTAITFHRQTGANLLIVGNDADAAQGTVATAIVALAAPLRTRIDEPAAQPDDGASYPAIVLLDGSPRDSPEAGYWRSFARIFGDCVQLAGPRDAAELVARLAAEQQRRAAERDVAHPPAFLFIYNLSRFRDLRKSEDDFGLGSFGSSAGDKPVDPGKQFADLLAGGPECGLHTVIWCDSYNNVDRWFSRQSLRELEFRVAFQMNASDSSNLIDSPAASKLGVHRALLYREETGASEKFRPYGTPTREWLQSVQDRLSFGGKLPAVGDLDAFQVQ